MNAGNTARKEEEKVLKMQKISHHKTLACLLLSIIAMAIVLINSISYFSAEIANDGTCFLLQQTAIMNPLNQIHTSHNKVTHLLLKTSCVLQF